MSRLSYNDMKGQTMSVNMLAQVTKLDRRTVEKYAEEEGLSAEEKPDGSRHFNFLDAIRAFITCSKGQSSADRRNEAQARKAEVETAILEEKFVPIEDILVPVRAVLGAVNKEIQDSEIEEDARERVASRVRECIGELTMEYDS